MIEIRAPEVTGNGISGTYGRHGPRSTGVVHSSTACHTASDLASILADFVREREIELRRRARFREGTEYNRELVHTVAGMEVWLLSWLPGQVTPIHDHGGVATVTTVLSGTVLEERFERTGGLEVRPTWTRLREVGDIDSIDPAAIHRVRPMVSALTLHLYVPACVEGQIYRAIGDCG